MLHCLRTCSHLILCNAQQKTKTVLASGAPVEMMPMEKPSSHDVVSATSAKADDETEKL